MKSLEVENLRLGSLLTYTQQKMLQDREANDDKLYHERDRANQAIETLKLVYTELSMKPQGTQTNAGIEIISADAWEDKVIKVRKIASKGIEKAVGSALK